MASSRALLRLEQQQDAGPASAGDGAVQRLLQRDQLRQDAAQAAESTFWIQLS